MLIIYRVLAAVITLIMMLCTCVRACVRATCPWRFRASVALQCATLSFHQVYRVFMVPDVSASMFKSFVVRCTPIDSL